MGAGDITISRNLPDGSMRGRLSRQRSCCLNPYSTQNEHRLKVRLTSDAAEHPRESNAYVHQRHTEVFLAALFTNQEGKTTQVPTIKRTDTQIGVER